MTSTQIPNYETRSLANNLKKQKSRVVFLVHDTSYQCDVCTHKVSRICSIRFRSLWPGHEVGRMDGQTHRINGMHALIKFPEYIPYDLGVMARTRSGTYGRTD